MARTRNAVCSVVIRRASALEATLGLKDAGGVFKVFGIPAEWRNLMDGSVE
ncbi:MAG: hypothetical protein ACLUNV_03955 [Sutterella wadsworthensis]